MLMDNECNTTKYLYGAAVQGIQDFIFQTNKLKEIVGASELVAQICTTAFGKLLGKNISDEMKMIEDDSNWIVGAAGNIKYIFNNREDCEKVVREFPRKVMTMAPGITISQCVVSLKEDLSDYAEKSQELEQNLRAQRSKAIRPTNIGLIAIKRAPATGLPGVEYRAEKKEEEKKLIDEASKRKIEASDSLKLAEKAFGEETTKDNLTSNIEEITDKNNWIAVIHADGNGLGKIVQTIGENKDEMKAFSLLLDKITRDSARVAFEQMRSLYFRDEKIIPMRPVILGGDDLTMICRADIAIEFTQAFLESFETFSKNQLSTLKVSDISRAILANGLTACAGIAFVKASYPFHYAVTLAEALCKRAKEKAKALDNTLAPSCLQFFKVQDSFVEDYSEIQRRTLLPQKNINFEYGPYYCGERAERVTGCSHTINQLINSVEYLKTDAAKGLKGNLRNWLTLLYEDVGKANQRMLRICSLQEGGKFKLEDYASLKQVKKKEQEKQEIKEMVYIPFYDILSLASLNIETKKSKEK